MRRVLGSREWTASTTWGACRASAPSRSSPTSPSSTTSGRARMFGGRRRGPRRRRVQHADVPALDRAHGPRALPHLRLLRALADRSGDPPGGGRLPHRDELEARAGPFPLSRPATVTAADVDGGPPVSVPRFDVGDGVRVRDERVRRPHPVPPLRARPAGPRRRGRGRRTVARARGARRGEGRRGRSTRCGFESTELWGDEASEHSCVHVDLYEHYLEPTEDAP